MKGTAASTMNNVGLGAAMQEHAEEVTVLRNALSTTCGRHSKTSAMAESAWIIVTVNRTAARVKYAKRTLSETKDQVAWHGSTGASESWSF